MSIISPTWSAQDFIQSLGRIHRAGAKTDAIQKVVFCEGTIEEFICDTLKYKLEHLSKFNDGDFDTYKIDGISNKPYDSDAESDDESPQEPVGALLGDDNKKTQESQKTKNLFNPMSNDNLSVPTKSKGKKKKDLNI